MENNNYNNKRELMNFILGLDGEKIKEMKSTLKTQVEAKLNQHKTMPFGNFFFGAPYFDPSNRLEELIKLIQQYEERDKAQERKMIGLLQATRSGKTRMLKELSLKRFVILISFESKGKEFLQKHFQKFGSKTNTFDEQRIENRELMLMIRIFLMSYVVYAFIFFELCGVSEWIKLTDEQKNCFTALLSNGGTDLVFEIFFLLQDYFLQKRQFNTNRNDDNDRQKKIEEELTILDETKVKVEKIMKIFLKYLKPIFAIDECHVALKVCRGVLFHSDFQIYLNERYSKETIYSWQQYEIGNQKLIPKDYPYKQPTSVLTGIRYIVGQFLQEDELRTMTLFASTYYSAMKTLTEKKDYSRQAVEIQPFSDFPQFESQTLKTFLIKQLSIKFQQQEINIDSINLQIWSGRTGFFMGSVWPRINQLEKFDLQVIQSYCENEKASVKRQIEDMFKTAENQSNKLVIEKERNTVMEYIQYFYCFRPIHLHSLIDDEFKTDAINTGFGIRLAEDNRVTICEPLVEEVLKERMATNWETNEQILFKEYANSEDNLAELAVAFQLLKNKGQLLFHVLESWQVSFDKKFLKQFKEDFCLEAKYIVDDRKKGHFTKETASFIFNPNSPLWEGNIILPRSGVRLPDILLYCQNRNQENGPDCLVSIQLKCQKVPFGDNLNAENSFKRSIMSVNFHHSLTDLDQHQNIDYSGRKTLLNYCNEKFKKQSEMLFLRIIICSGQFTLFQSEIIQEWNQQNPFSPIFLLPINQESAESIFTKRVFQKLDQVGKFPNLRKNVENINLPKTDQEEKNSDQPKKKQRKKRKKIGSAKK